MRNIHPKRLTPVYMMMMMMTMMTTVAVASLIPKFFRSVSHLVVRVRGWKQDFFQFAILKFVAFPATLEKFSLRSRHLSWNMEIGI
jgi:hypothetical protein